MRRRAQENSEKNNIRESRIKQREEKGKSESTGCTQKANVRVLQLAIGSLNQITLMAINVNACSSMQAANKQIQSSHMSGAKKNPG